MTTKRLIVAITGASGAIYGIRLLQVLRTLPGWETHLVMSASGALTASQEVDLKRSEFVSLRQRAAPFIDMLRRSAEGGHDVVWGA